MPTRVVVVRDGTCQTQDEAVDTSDDMCVICYVKPRTHASLPCGHCCWCHSCAERQEQRTGTRGVITCPLCREPASVGLFQILDALEDHTPAPDSEAAAESGLELLSRRARRRRRHQQMRPRGPCRSLAELLQQADLANTVTTVERPCWFASDEAACQTAGTGAPVCVSCLEQTAEVAAVPCGHRCLCKACAEQERRRPDAVCVCPWCHREAMGFFKIY